MSFTEKDEALVKDSWAIMKKHKADFSFRFFTIVLEIAPAAKGMFSFLKDTDEIPQNNKKLINHADAVFKMTYDAAVQLGEKGEVSVKEKALKRMGDVHVTSGVVDPHFEVVKEAMLRTVEDTVGDIWSDEMKSAWGVAYDQLATAIKAEMKEFSKRKFEIKEEVAKEEVIKEEVAK